MFIDYSSVEGILDSRSQFQTDKAWFDALRKDIHSIDPKLYPSLLRSTDSDGIPFSYKLYMFIPPKATVKILRKLSPKTLISVLEQTIPVKRESGGSLQDIIFSPMGHSDHRRIRSLVFKMIPDDKLTNVFKNFIDSAGSPGSSLRSAFITFLLAVRLVRGDLSKKRFKYFSEKLKRLEQKRLKPSNLAVDDPIRTMATKHRAKHFTADSDVILSGAGGRMRSARPHFPNQVRELI